ncbi:hypothetical protein SLS62_011074 [Diatrype stigma]|uniref:NAD(P)-binding domain-containing protein n=1 Tax=Diatrype stigma TaxID=117547 RepID=A0AAN9YG92_9PEZI
MSSIKNVAIAGASGDLGSVVFEKLVASGKFNIRVLRRTGSSAKFPAGTDVVDVDFDSLESVKSALAGQDAVVSTVGSTAVQSQKVLIDASIAAGVKRILPSDFGSNLDNPLSRKLPVYVQKIEAQQYAQEKAKTTDLSYTFIYNSAFLDWGLTHNFILNVAEGKAQLLDGGDVLFSTTTLASVADGIIGVLSHPEETKNRSVFIHNAVVSQNKLLALAKKADPSKSWEVVSTKLDDVVAEAYSRLSKGILDAQTFIPFLYRAIFDPAYGGNFTGFTDNALLGVKEFSEEELFEVVNKAVTA